MKAISEPICSCCFGYVVRLKLYCLGYLFKFLPYQAVWLKNDKMKTRCSSFENEVLAIVPLYDDIKVFHAGKENL